jgi:hypothetical protein
MSVASSPGFTLNFPLIMGQPMRGLMALARPGQKNKNPK